MNAIRAGLTMGFLLPIVLTPSYALAAPPAGTVLAPSGARIGQSVVPAQKLLGDSKKPFILTLAILLGTLDLYEILRHHHHPSQPVSP